jgi:hypothetical protein
VTPSSRQDNDADSKEQALPKGGLRVFLYITFEEPSSSMIAQAIASFILMCIVVSIVALILESDPQIKQPYETELSTVEVMTTMIFTVEYLIRLLVRGVGGLTFREFVLAPTNIIDLCAIVPFYVEKFFQFAGGDGEGSVDVKFLKVLRAIRLVRLFRVFKVSRFAAGVRVMGEAISNSSHALNTLVFFVAVAMILFSSAVYYSEKLMCPVFDMSEASQQKFMLYEEECRLGLPSLNICCDYACNPQNPGVGQLPTNLDEYHALGMPTKSPVNSSTAAMIRNFPNTLCVYSLTDEEWREARNGAIAAGEFDGDFDSRFIVAVVSSNQYISIPHTFWWSLVSMTTTGFGDEVPETPAGKFFAIIAMCFGILLIALPVAIVGSKFQEAFAQMEAEQAKLREEKAEKIRRSLSMQTRANPPPGEPDASPRVEVPPEPTIEVSEIAATYFPKLVHLAQEVPEDHPAHATVRRVAQSYDELANVQAAILAAQTINVQNQQAFGVDMGILVSNVGESYISQNMPPKRVVNPKPDPI